MSGSQKSLEPVAPDGMELLFFYRCPHCLRHVPLVNPVEPRNVRCDGCGKQFPIIPVDEHGLHYVRIMLANGKAMAKRRAAQEAAKEQQTAKEPVTV